MLYFITISLLSILKHLPSSRCSKVTLLMELRFSQPNRTVSGHIFCQKINWNRVWHVIYGWKDLHVGCKFWYSIQWISPWKYTQIRKSFFSPRVQKKLSIFLKERWRYVKQHCVIMDTYIYHVEAFKFRLLQTCS